MLINEKSGASIPHTACDNTIQITGNPLKESCIGCGACGAKM